MALDDVSLDLAAGEFFCLLGPSGCGKSTLLRLIAGFEAPTSGTLHLAGEDMAARPPHRRPVNMMFQSYALFPHMDVAANVGYGLKGLGRAGIAARVDELLRLVRLDGFGRRRPDTLSGGQRQRVALARALAREPKILLLDEPLGALDRTLRDETQGELRALQKRLGTTFIVVTHDPGEAMALADRIGVMDRGRLVQVGDAATLYERPATRFVAGLLGDVNLIAGQVADRTGDIARVETGLGSLHAGVQPDAPGAGAAVVVALRPERIVLGPADTATDAEPNALAGHVTEITYLGDRIRHRVRMADGSEIRATVAAGGQAPAFAPGDAVALGFPPGAATLLPA
ncbi:ABC transporter ATP-binding protein [Methylobacterium sp. BTF04]|nr:ABC transporter ATP-binding protein [Methylobacterium sp. BTF04]